MVKLCRDMFLWIVVLSCINTVKSLDNGLVKTPPMGWLAWLAFQCNVDCDASPDTCISEALFKRTADAMVSGGYLNAGYEYVIMDDCWLASERDSQGRLQADPDRFPNGIKNLSEYVHSKGLKFGIYEDVGTETCAGYPGMSGNLELDAQTFADWEVDYIKVDGCDIRAENVGDQYIEFGKYLNKTGRAIVYATEWPFYQVRDGIEVDYEAVADTCNVFRDHNDIRNSWKSLVSVMNYMAENQDVLQPVGGPGHWNDPDMLIIGNSGLNEEQAKVQMAIWSILAAPLLMSTDLDTISDVYRDILLNKNFISVNQDPLGIQGIRFYKDDILDIWRRPISPTRGNQFSYAIAILYMSAKSKSINYTTTLKDIGLTSDNGYALENWLTGESLGNYVLEDELTVNIASRSGAYLRAVVISPD